jgi:hypothetical protein
LTLSQLRPVFVSKPVLRATSTQFSTSPCYKSISRDDRRKIEAGCLQQQQESFNEKGRQEKSPFKGIVDSGFETVVGVAAVAVAVAATVGAAAAAEWVASQPHPQKFTIKGEAARQVASLTGFYTKIDWAVCGTCDLIIPIVKLWEVGQCHMCGCRTMKKAGIALERTASVVKNEDGETELKTDNGFSIATLVLARKPQGIVC